MKTKLQKFSTEPVKVIEIMIPEQDVSYKLPLFLESVSAGFPSPADDYMEHKLDLNEFIIKTPAATFFVRVTGDSMNLVGIHSGDILVVDRSLTPKDGSIIIAVIDGELTVKRLQKQKNQIFLLAENPKYKPIQITSEMNFEVWGVVSYVIHSLI